MQNRRERGAKLIVIDPRETGTAEDADLFLPIAPGTDTALFCGLLAHLAQSSAFDRAYVEAHTNGFEAALTRAQEIAPNVAATAAACGLDENDVARFFAMFTATANTVTCFSQGVNQSAQGTDKVNAIINCHLATGRIGRAGMGPFSLTGQPNAMGGREVGGLANQLAAHMGFSPAEIDRVRRFWTAPRMAEHEGLKAVQMFEAIERGEIKALWVMATNPAVSLPRAGAMRDALKKLDLFIVSENVLSNDTVNAGAHILLPAAAWGEKDGTVTNSERRISRQRAFLPLPGEARPDWWIVSEVARRIGFAKAFPYRFAADIFREHAALSAFENHGARDFDLGGMATVADDYFAAFDPFQWPLPDGDQDGKARMFADGLFFTPDRKAKFIAPDAPALREAVSDAQPFRLNTGRVRDQWHTMTRTGKSPRLGAHLPEPFVEVHPADAQTFGLADNEFAEVTTRHARCVFRVHVSNGQREGSLFAPIHWSGENSSLGRTGDLVAPFNDPFSGQPEAKATPAAIAPVTFALRGFVLTRRQLQLPEGSWWTRIAVRGGFGYVFAANGDTSDWQDMIRSAAGAGAVWIEYADATNDVYRACTLHNGRLDLCLFAGPAASMPDWDHLKALFAAPSVGDIDRRHLLSGEAADAAANTGPLVCACFGVGVNTIREAIASRAATSVEQIGKALRAGTNCGSCIPEMKKLLAQAKPDEKSHDRLAHTA
jgi:assimilatory nitrate reductase catalytic subunit